MNIDDFIKLPAGEAGWLYRHHRDAGDAAEASRLHQAYFEVHRVKLSDDRQIAEAIPTSTAARPEPTQRVESARKPERSKVRRIGSWVSCLGLIVSLFAAAAGLGSAGLLMGGGLVSCGFALWLAGVLEDRLISIGHAIESR